MASLPKHKYLLIYRYAEIIHDGVVIFCNRYLGEIKFRRTCEQMIQSARSGKHLVEHLLAPEVYVLASQGRVYGARKYCLPADKLRREPCTNSTEKANGKIRREDFLRQRDLKIWPKTDPRILKFRRLGVRLSHLSNLGNLGNLKEKLVLPNNSEEAANLLLTFCHMETYLLSKQIKAVEEKFIKEGGYSENLFKKRLRSRI